MNESKYHLLMMNCNPTYKSFNLCQNHFLFNSHHKTYLNMGIREKMNKIFILTPHPMYQTPLIKTTCWTLRWLHGKM